MLVFCLLMALLDLVDDTKRSIKRALQSFKAQFFSYFLIACGLGGIALTAYRTNHTNDPFQLAGHTLLGLVFFNVLMVGLIVRAHCDTPASK